MSRPIKDPKHGVAVKILPCNARKVIQVIKKTKRSFASEVNVAVEEQMDAKIVKFKDDGR
jgi:hypothetical protein